MPKQKVKLAHIVANIATQPRVEIVHSRINEYIEDMSRGDKFPPMTVFRESATKFWLADGFHRYHAAVGLELKEIVCDVRKGKLRDATLFSVGANAEHGIRRTNEDKRAAVTKLLGDKIWSKWSDPEVAERCHVTREFVLRLRAKLFPPDTSDPITSKEEQTRDYIHPKTGKQTTMKTGNIGKKKPKPAEPKPDQKPDAAPRVSAQVKADQDNAYISACLFEINRQIGRLPDAKEAARLFPSNLRHTFTVDKLRAMAQWLSDFADAWPAGEAK